LYFESIDIVLIIGIIKRRNIMAKTATYTIEGKVFTVPELSRQLGMSAHSAKRRLQKAKTIKDLFKPKASGHPTITYNIEGVKYTAKQLADELNCSLDTARYRLSQFKTLDQLRKPVITYDTCISPTPEELKEKEMLRLAMKAI